MRGVSDNMTVQVRQQARTSTLTNCACEKRVRRWCTVYVYSAHSSVMSSRTWSPIKSMVSLSCHSFRMSDIGVNSSCSLIISPKDIHSAIRATTLLILEAATWPSSLNKRWFPKTKKTVEELFSSVVCEKFTHGDERKESATRAWFTMIGSRQRSNGLSSSS